MANVELNTLMAKRDKLKAQLALVEELIEEAQNESSTSGQINFIGEDKTEGYESAQEVKSNVPDQGLPSSFPKKFLHILKLTQRFMKVREIAEEIFAIEGGDLDDIVAKLSRSTNKLKEMNFIVKYQVGKSRLNAFWGSPNWLEGETIKEKYLYNKSALTSSRANSFSEYDL